MIIDITKFIKKEKKYWKKFENMLNMYSNNSAKDWDINELKEFHYLYEKVSSDLIKLSTFYAERELRKYLENLVSRGYSILYSKTKKRVKPQIKKFILNKFPTTFRKNFQTFLISCLVTVIGVIFGGVMSGLDKDAKSAIYPAQFNHLQQSASDRVAKEEKESDSKANLGYFASSLMTHNIKVSITTFAFGILFGVGSIVLLFYNGVILGAVAIEYILAGETTFLIGWLLPHGIIEIPAILIAGQAGLILGSCILRPNGKARIKALKEKLEDMTTLIIGLAGLLVWAGIIEAFFSQYHEPVIPYYIKISFGVIEAIILFFYLFLSGRNKVKNEK